MLERFDVGIAVIANAYAISTEQRYLTENCTKTRLKGQNKNRIVTRRLIEVFNE